MNGFTNTIRLLPLLLVLALASSALAGSTEELQKVAGRFLKVPVATQIGQVRPFSVTLNQNLAVNYNGYRYDCLRFTVPKKLGDMAWAFFYTDSDAVKSGLQAWYVIPAAGRMPDGFQNFFRIESSLFSNIQALGIREERRGAVQHLKGEYLQSERDYLIWFKFDKAAPLNLKGCLNIAGKRVPNDLAPLLGAVGLKLRQP